jgi:rubrerythrin
VRKQAQAVGAALLKSVGDQARGDQAGKNARDGYMAEHLEIAAYQLLERLAEKAGDTETAEVARLNRADEEEMARRIDQSWDRTLELTLEENNISAGPVSGVTDTVDGTTSTVTDTVGGATDSVRGVTDNLLGDQEKQR